MEAIGPEPPDYPTSPGNHAGIFSLTEFIDTSYGGGGGGRGGRDGGSLNLDDDGYGSKEGANVDTHDGPGGASLLGSGELSPHLGSPTGSQTLIAAPLIPSATAAPRPTADTGVSEEPGTGALTLALMEDDSDLLEQLSRFCDPSVRLPTPSSVAAAAAAAAARQDPTRGPVSPPGPRPAPGPGSPHHLPPTKSTTASQYPHHHLHIPLAPVGGPGLAGANIPGSTTPRPVPLTTRLPTPADGRPPHSRSSIATSHSSSSSLLAGPAASSSESIAGTTITTSFSPISSRRVRQTIDILAHRYRIYIHSLKILLIVQVLCWFPIGLAFLPSIIPRVKATSARAAGIFSTLASAVGIATVLSIDYSCWGTTNSSPCNPALDIYKLLSLFFLPHLGFGISTIIMAYRIHYIIEAINWLDPEFFSTDELTATRLPRLFFPMTLSCTDPEGDDSPTVGHQPDIRPP